MNLAWKSNQPSGRKMVLLALCDNANDQGECFPSVPMIAQKCSMGERTVQQHITDLEEIGAVAREMRIGRSTIYHLDPRKFCTPAESAPPQNLHPTPAESAPITTKEPPKEPSGNHHKRAKAAQDDFVPMAALLEAGVDEQTAKDWLQLRKKKRADVSRTVLEQHVKQAWLAGMTLTEALQMSCLRGWQGFDAQFVRSTPQARASPANKQLDLAAAQKAANEEAKRRLFGNDDGRTIDA